MMRGLASEKQLWNASQECVLPPASQPNVIRKDRMRGAELYEPGSSGMRAFCVAALLNQAVR